VCETGYYGIICADKTPSNPIDPSCCITQLAIGDQPSNSLQIVNCTSEDPLNVFLVTLSVPWAADKNQGATVIYPAVNWGAPGCIDDLLAWDPVGAQNLTQVVIPKGGSVVLIIPSDMFPRPKDKFLFAFRVTPLKLRDHQTRQIETSSDAKTRVMVQWPVLLEGGMEMVADSSAADGVNFRMRYELTSDDNSVKVMMVNKNPCEGLGDKYMLDVGCRCPASVDCHGPTCDCTPDTQECKFNTCSQTLFDIPKNLQNCIGHFDQGADNKLDIVKNFINDERNIKHGSALRSYCTNLHWGSGDFTPYCYDYNDKSASPWLRKPYKLKVTFIDL